jgi:hypothetical protein
LFFAANDGLHGDELWSLAPNIVQPLVGDYSGNGIVDAADYVVWRSTLGSTTDLRANGDNTGASAGVIDQADYSVWRSNFGNTASGSGSGAVAAVEIAPSTLGPIASSEAVVEADTTTDEGGIKFSPIFFPPLIGDTQTAIVSDKQSSAFDRSSTIDVLRTRDLALLQLLQSVSIGSSDATPEIAHEHVARYCPPDKVELSWDQLDSFFNVRKGINASTVHAISEWD